MTNLGDASAFSAIMPNISTIGSRPIRMLISAPELNWRDSVIARLNELVALEIGWDGYDGRPVSFEVANFALRVLETVCQVDAPEPQIVPGNSGDLQIEWHTPEGDIELHVREPNDVHAWRSQTTPVESISELFLKTDFIEVAGWIKELGEPSRAASVAAA